MKSKALTYMVALLGVVAMSLVSCSKMHQCKCVASDGTDDGLLQLLELDGGLSCEDIQEMAFERHTVTEDGQYSLERIDVHPVKCRDYGE